MVYEVNFLQVICDYHVRNVHVTKNVQQYIPANIGLIFHT